MIETALRERSTLDPGYPDCIAVYSDDEKYAVALTQRNLAAWRKTSKSPPPPCKWNA